MNLSLSKCLCSLAETYQILAYECIIMKQHVLYILDLSMTLIFDLCVGGGVSLVSFTHSLYLVNTIAISMLCIVKHHQSIHNSSHSLPNFFQM